MAHATLLHACLHSESRAYAPRHSSLSALPLDFPGGLAPPSTLLHHHTQQHKRQRQPPTRMPSPPGSPHAPSTQARPTVLFTNSSAVPRLRPTPDTSYLSMALNSEGVMKRE